MPISESAAKKELLKRLAFSKSRPIELDPIFPVQNKFIEDTSRFIVAQCSRRAGKSNGLAIRYFKTMEKYPKSTCIYLSMTRESAQAIMWPVLQELNDKYKIGCKFLDSKLTILHPNGSKLRLYGADMKNFIKRLKGQKSPGIGIDESQDFGSHLQTLIDDVLTPMLTDYADSWLACTGTPGPVPQGYFFDITQGRKYGYSYHEWTLLDNPYLPNPKEFIEDLKDKREWDDNNPTLLREWLNRWVLDVQSLWIQYNTLKSNYSELPSNWLPPKTHYILGIDIGFKDSDALAVLAYGEDSKTTYLVEELVTGKQGLTELTDQIQALRKKYSFSKMVIDEGGLGKKLAEEMRRRYLIPVEAADKVRKQENVELLNDAMRLGIFKAKISSRFVKDSYLVQIDWEKSTPGKIVIKKHPHSDIIDAVLYAFKESPAYSYEKEVPKPKVGTKEWADAQENEMWENAVTHFQEEKERNKRLFGED